MLRSGESMRGLRESIPTLIFHLTRSCAYDFILCLCLNHSHDVSSTDHSGIVNDGLLLDPPISFHIDTSRVSARRPSNPAIARILQQDSHPHRD